MELEVFSDSIGVPHNAAVHRMIQVPEGTGVLDEVPWLPEALEKAEAALKYWKGRVEELKDAVRLVAGEHEILTLHGKPEFTYKGINTFQGARFKKDHPDLWEAYLHPVTKDELDVKTLASARPDLYAEYQSRQLRRA